MTAYSFRLVTPNDFDVLERWAETPDVKRWWPELDLDGEDLADPRTRLWIVSLDERPFAYLQDYDPHGWPEHHFAGLPAKSRGIDQFIGEPDLLNRGHGSAFIRAHVESLFSEGAPVVGTDPHPENTRAIRAYEKAGFVRGDVRVTAWGVCLLMTQARDALSTARLPPRRAGTCVASGPA